MVSNAEKREGNKSDPTTKKTMCKLLPKNDHVHNKDRQDPVAVLKLTGENFTSFLGTVGYVGHTIIPKLDKYTEHNQVGMFPNSISMAIRPFGSLLFIHLDPATGRSNIILATLHSPITKLKTVVRNMDTKEVQNAQGVAFFCSKGTQIGFCELNKGAVILEPKRLRTRQEVMDTVRTMGLWEDANLTNMRNSINQHLIGLRNLYKEKEFLTNQINFWTNEDLMTFSCVHVIDLELIYAASISANRLYQSL